MLANLVCSLIKHRRVTTTLAKAKAARPVAEKLVTLAKKGTLHHRRLAASRLPEKDAVTVLFREIAETHRGRNGGYTRIVRLHQRPGDAAPMAILEWVDEVVQSGAETSSQVPAPAAPASEPAPKQAEQPAAEEGAAEKSSDADKPKEG